MVEITRDTTLEDLRALAKSVRPSSGLRAQFVQSVQQSLRVEGYLLGEDQVRRAVEGALNSAKR